MPYLKRPAIPPEMDAERVRKAVLHENWIYKKTNLNKQLETTLSSASMATSVR